MEEHRLLESTFLASVSFPWESIVCGLHPFYVFAAVVAALAVKVAVITIHTYRRWVSKFSDAGGASKASGF